MFIVFTVYSFIYFYLYLFIYLFLYFLEYLIWSYLILSQVSFYFCVINATQNSNSKKLNEKKVQLTVNDRLANYHYMQSELHQEKWYSIYIMVVIMIMIMIVIKNQFLFLFDSSSDKYIYVCKSSTLLDHMSEYDEILYDIHKYIYQSMNCICILGDDEIR